MNRKKYIRCMFVIVCAFIYTIEGSSLWAKDGNCTVNSVSPTQVVFDYFGSSDGSLITVQASCTNYTVTAPSWITYHKNGLYVGLTASLNTGPTRIGTVYIGDKTVAIAQDGYCPKPSTPTITASGPTSFCDGGSVILTCSSADGYLWSTGEVTNSITATSTWTYTVQVSNSSGCYSENSQPVTVTVNPAPAITISNNGPVCEGYALNLTVSSSGTSYIWRGPNGFTSSSQNLSFPNSTPDLSGTYTLDATSAYGCTGSASTQVTVKALTPVVLQSNKIICEGEALTLEGPDGMTSYSWAGPDNFTSSDQNPLVSGTVTTAMSGTYSLSVQNSNNCPSVGTEEIIIKSFDKSLPVGSIGGGFNVSSSGAANYQIPIFTSPGTNGLKPSLSVAYNSQAGNGYLGMGWNLTGLSSISRLPLTIKDDGQVRAVQLDATDPFGLDGNRLVVTNDGVYGANNTEYHTQAETFVRVTSYGSSGSAPRWFKVETKDGRTIEYGNSETSYLQAPDRDDIIYWYVSKITDTKGNYMTYTYHVDRSNGEFWPEKIEYTGNDNTGLAPYNSINFTYQTRQDNTTVYLAGYPIQHNVLLSQIQVISEGNTIREYDFNYTKNACTQLNEVALYGKDHTKINSTFVNWISSAEKAGWFQSQFSVEDNLLIDDFNGDGKKEILTSRSGYVYELNNNKTSFSVIGTSGLPTISSLSKSGDFDGDGKSDVVLSLTDSENTFAFYKSNGNSFSFVGNYGSANPHITGETLCPGDYNGDGITDLIINNNIDPTPYVYWGDQTSPFSNSTALSGVNWGNKQYFADFNGDGKIEVMTLDASGYKVYEWQATAFLLVQSGAMPNNSNDLYFGDFNGDGKRDFIYRTGTSTTFTMAISTGISFVTYTQTLTGKFDYISINDADGDGHDDFIGNSTVYAWRENSLVVAGGRELSYFSNVNDFDGDGNADCLMYDDIPGVNLLFMLPNFNASIHKKVSSITNGMENTIFITYKPLTDNTIHTLSSDGAYRSIDFAPSTLVVSSVQADNGMGGQNQVDYHYAGAKFDNRDGQFLGFASVSQTNNTSGLISTSYSDIDYTYYISKPTRSEVTKADGTSLTEATYATTIRDFDNNRLFVYQGQQTSIDHLHGDATTTSSIVYDDDGNPTNISKNAGGIATSSTTNTFTTAGGGWCPNKVETTTTTGTRTGETNYITATSFSYNAYGLLEQQISEPGDAKQVYTNYTYDDFGNVTQVKVSPDGVTGRITNLQYETDKARMVTQRSNVLGHYVNFTNDYGLGVVTQTVDNNNLTTSYQYDNFGKLTQTTNPDGTTKANTLNWVTDHTPENAVFYSTTQATGVPDVTQYFDGLGRQLRAETTGFDGRKLITETGYTTKGQVDFVTLPYYDGDDNTDRKSYTYDALGRIYTEKAPGLDLTYTYDGLSTTVTNNLNGQSTTKTADASGSLVQSSDNGGTISYTYNAMGQVRKVTSPSGINTMGYDQFGRQTNLSDPNTGGITYDYNVYGELVSQNDVMNNSVSLSYDDIGRVYNRTENSMTTDWVYNDNGRLDSETASTGITYNYTYDPQGRPKIVKETESNVFKTDFTTSYEYEDGRVSKVTYPSGFIVDYYYTNGYLDEIKRDDNGASIWKLDAVNARGQVTQSTAGNGLVTIKGYDSRGYLQSINTGSGSIQDLEYSFTVKGLLDWRKDNRHAAITESFGYDNTLNRLTSSTINGVTKSITYADNGNILSKSDAGTFAYSADHPNAIETLTDNKGMVSSQKQDITYTSFSMPATLTENGNTASFTYGPGHERKVLVTNQNGGTSKYYSGSYERQDAGGITRELHYITANGQIVAIFEQKSTGETNMYYVHTDHLGSLNVITNSTGTIVQETSYDAWGNRRDPATLQNYTTTPTGLITDRGFTGHEHMDAFKLINMNGRIYDPALGRFLSPDAFVQAPDFTQSYNRYSYCMNNPLMFTDPSGYLYESAYERWLDSFFQGTNDGCFGGSVSSGGHSSASGNFGYTYDKENGVYRDKYTGAEVDYQAVMDWMINDARMNGGILFSSSGNSVIFSGSDNSGFQFTVNGKNAVTSIAVSNSTGQMVVLGQLTGLQSERTIWDIYADAFGVGGQSTGGQPAQSQGGRMSFEGVPVYVNEHLAYGAAYTIPEIGITVSTKIYDYKNIKGTHGRDVLRHEFGHILQNDYFGRRSYNVIMFESFISATFSNNHQGNWTEMLANTMSYIYFGNPSDWNKADFPINLNMVNQEMSNWLNAWKK